MVVRALELSRHASPPLFPPLHVPARYPRLSASIKPLDHFSCSLAACVWIRHCRRDSRSRKHRGADRRRNFLRNISTQCSNTLRAPVSPLSHLSLVCTTPWLETIPRLRVQCAFNSSFRAFTLSREPSLYRVECFSGTRSLDYSTILSDFSRQGIFRQMRACKLRKKKLSNR